ncbi:MAG: ribonuclease HII [Desulfuromonadaceae bacterium]
MTQRSKSKLGQTPLNTLEFECSMQAQGYRAIAGIDEAGRGPLAGPVVAAAVILPQRFDLPGLTDSKKLSPKRRVKLFHAIRQQALAIGTGFASAARIDTINVLQATLEAMVLAIEHLPQIPDCLLVDGISSVPLDLPQHTIKQGDSRSLSIAAASIIAKVTRDRMMRAYAHRYPAYAFDTHKGYGTAEHRRLIAEHGPCAIHRTTFGGVREHL